MKIHFRHLHAPLCGIFVPNSGYIARYAPFIRGKYTTNCDAHLTERLDHWRVMRKELFNSIQFCRNERMSCQ